MFRSIYRSGGLALALTLGCRQSFDCTSLYPSPSGTAPARELVIGGVRTRVAVTGAPRTLAIVSPGLGAELTDFDPLARTMAADGYAVVVVEHPVSLARTVCGALSGAACWTKLMASETIPENWFARFDDVRRVMADAPPALGVDGEHIVLLGHSFGAFTTMAFGGTTFVDPRTQVRHDLYDRRVVAVVAMSPQGPRWFGLDEESWSAVKAPLLLITGDRDGTVAIDDSPEWRREPFAHLEHGTMLRLRDGGHMAYTAPATIDLVSRVALAFITPHVRHTPSTLTATAVETCSRGAASLQTR